MSRLRKCCSHLSGGSFLAGKAQTEMKIWCMCMLKVVSSETNLGFKGFEYMAIHSDNDTAKILSLQYYEALYRSLMKEHPSEEHLTKRGVGALHVFPHLTTKEHLCHVTD